MKKFEDLSERPYFDSQNKDLEGFNVVMDPSENGKEILYAFSQSKGYAIFPGLDWILVIEYDANEVLESVEILKIQIIPISIILAGVAIVIGFFMSRSITVPLKHLTRITKSVSKENFDHRVNPEGPDEIQLLAKSFNKMIDSLKKSTSRIEQLNKLDKMKMEFLAMMTHELKTPLTAIIGWCDILKRPDAMKKLSEEQKKEALNTVRINAVRLNHLISDLLDSQKTRNEENGF